MKSAPLPADIEDVLRIAAGDENVIRAIIESSGRSQDVLRQASTFFIEQILFAPEADSYRVLGAKRTAKPQELRRNMALLLRWLHPDAQHGEARSVYVARVTRAWEDIKTSERRRAYDVSQDNAPRRTSSTPRQASAGKRIMRRISADHLDYGTAPRTIFQRLLVFVFGHPPRRGRRSAAKKLHLR
jgi:DnaJ-class molecular chaperone